GLSNRVKFLGLRRDVPFVLAAADVLVHPARYEAYGLGVHEAVCRGVPSIVTAIAGVTERFPPTLGSLIVSDPPRADALATTLRAWRTGADTWRARVAPVGAALRSRSWDDMSAEIVARAEEASAGPAQRGGRSRRDRARRVEGCVHPDRSLLGLRRDDADAGSRGDLRAERVQEAGSAAGRLLGRERGNRRVRRMRLRAAGGAPGDRRVFRSHVRPALVRRLDRARARGSLQGCDLRRHPPRARPASSAR